jgi:hypothetical protein
MGSTSASRAQSVAFVSELELHNRQLGDARMADVFVGVSRGRRRTASPAACPQSETVAKRIPRTTVANLVRCWTVWPSVTRPLGGVIAVDRIDWASAVGRRRRHRDASELRRSFSARIRSLAAASATARRT